MRKRGLLLCLALLLVLCQGCTWPGRKTVTIGGQSVTIDPNVPENTLDAADFSQQADGKVIYTGGKYLTGIDVSAHQGKINWKKVAKQVDFSMIQVGYRGYTEGKLAEDERFRENIQQALKYKLKVGVYFFSQAITPKEAKAEAKYLLKLIKDYDITLNVAYDWEYIDNVDFGTARTDKIKENTVTECAAAFCKTIADAGYQPAIYCNGMLGYFSYDLSKLSGVDVWYANYADPSPEFAYQIRMWQYSDKGKLEGVTGNVDLNLYFYDQASEKKAEKTGVAASLFS